MGNKLVIRIPAVLLLFVVCLSISKVIAVKGIQLPLPTVITDLIDKKVAAEIITKAKPHTNLSEMEQIVNGIRVDNQLSVLKMNEEVCANFSTWNQPSAESVFSVCENCRHVAIVKISSIARPAQIQEYLDGDRSAKVILQNPELTHMCLK